MLLEKFVCTKLRRYKTLTEPGAFVKLNQLLTVFHDAAHDSCPQSDIKMATKIYSFLLSSHIL